jgi:glucosamine--fructose-6-phosphate aminotransferase (isomerizing)
MCGIIGYLGAKPLLPVLIEGLRRLEYRGYDSAGVAVVRNGHVSVRRAPGKLARLEEAIHADPLDGDYGLGHTRWATHGRPTEENAHPHRDCTGRLVVVHNGIIENYIELKQDLQRQGHVFVTETDTEVVAHLVEQELSAKGGPLEAAVRRALAQLRGLYALVLLSADDPDKLVVARNGPPHRTFRPFSATHATSCSSTTKKWPSSRAAAWRSRGLTAQPCRRPHSAWCGIRSRRKRPASSTSC